MVYLMLYNLHDKILILVFISFIINIKCNSHGLFYLRVLHIHFYWFLEVYNSCKYNSGIIIWFIFVIYDRTTVDYNNNKLGHNT